MKTIAKTTIIGNFIGKIGFYFLTGAFLYWGWNVVAPHLNAPLFTYWEMMAIRMAIGSLVRMFIPIEGKA